MVGGKFSGGKRYEGVRFNVLSVTRGWVWVQGKICNANNIILYQDDNALDYGMYNVEEKEEKLFKKRTVLFPTATFYIQIK